MIQVKIKCVKILDNKETLCFPDYSIIICKEKHLLCVCCGFCFYCLPFSLSNLRWHMWHRESQVTSLQSLGVSTPCWWSHTLGFRPSYSKGLVYVWCLCGPAAPLQIVWHSWILSQVVGPGWDQAIFQADSAWELVWNRKLSKSFTAIWDGRFFNFFFFLGQHWKSMDFLYFYVPLCLLFLVSDTVWKRAPAVLMSWMIKYGCGLGESGTTGVQRWHSGPSWLHHVVGDPAHSRWCTLTFHTFPALGHALLGQSLQPSVLLISVSRFLWFRAHKCWQASWTQ